MDPATHEVCRQAGVATEQVFTRRRDLPWARVVVTLWQRLGFTGGFRHVHRIQLENQPTHRSDDSRHSGGRIGCGCTFHLTVTGRIPD